MKKMNRDKIKEFFNGRAILFTMLSVLLLVSIIFNITLVRQSFNKDDSMNEVLTVLGSDERISEIENTDVNDKKRDGTINWLNDELGDTFYASYDPQVHAITLKIVGKGLMNDFNGTMSGRMSATVWDGLFESMAELSTTVSSRANDEELSMTILNPMDQTSGFLVVKNGKIMFDGFESIGLK